MKKEGLRVTSLAYQFCRARMKLTPICVMAACIGGGFLWRPDVGRSAAPAGSGISPGTLFSFSLEDAQKASPRSISGTILDPSGAAISGAAVILHSGDGKELSRVSSDKDGGFQFENLGPGAYKIEAQAAGFRDTIVELRLGLRVPSPLRVVLPIAVQNEVVNVAGGDVSLAVITDGALGK
jgi:hypothetical protein